MKAQLNAKTASQKVQEEVAETPEWQAELYAEFLAELAADREYWTEEDWEAQRKFDAQVALMGSPV